MFSSLNKPTRILLVDDEPANLHVLRQVLQDEYHLIFAKNGADAIRLAAREHPDLILLDVMMPGMSGFEACAALKACEDTRRIPVIFVTALRDADDEAKGFAAGAVDYIAKPISPAVVKARVKTHLSLVATDELRETRLQIIQRLGRASEFKDNETGLHVIRMSHYSKILALGYGYSEAIATELFYAAPMHDIGKIGIPDSIILKPGKLTADEFEHMKKHTLFGAEILGESESELIKVAKTVALHHHEKWDGSGYPFGLKGYDIPIEARIVALADVFDALTSVRPYKAAWSVEKTLAFIHEQSGLHFEPRLVNILQDNIAAITEIMNSLQEEA